MAVKKTKVVLDADVINHFARGGRLSMLPKILPEFQFIVLDVVIFEYEISLPAINAARRNVKAMIHVCKLS